MKALAISAGSAAKTELLPPLFESFLKAFSGIKKGGEYPTKTKEMYGMVKNATIEELTSVKTRTEILAFKGEESFKSLKCLNRLAHFAIHGSIFDLQKNGEHPFGPSPVYFLNRFMNNESFLNSVETQEGESQENGFRKVQKRLLEDINFFLEQAKSAISRPQLNIYHTRSAPHSVPAPISGFPAK